MKRKILIASFLKPVNDIRSFEKMALSIAKNNRYDVSVTGYPADSITDNKNVTLVPLKPFKKSGFERLGTRFQVLKFYLKLKPEVIIVNSPDLLLITVLNRILFGTKIIYDIQENYFRNLWYQKNYPFGIRHAAAIFIRTKEALLSPFFHHFLLAENIYESQLKFIGRRFTILENKSLEPNKVRSARNSPNALQFLMSGTIAKEYGVLEGIRFFEFIKSKIPISQLLIIGHCPNSSTYQQLEKIAEKNDSISLEMSSTPINHNKIEQAVLASHFGLLPYLHNKSTKGKWPTKLFEYMAYKLPVIIQSNTTWNEFVLKNTAGLIIDFTNHSEYETSSIIEDVLTPSFYQQDPPDSILWKTEEDKLINMLDNLD